MICCTSDCDSANEGCVVSQLASGVFDRNAIDIAHTAENEEAFGRPGASRGSTAYPQMRFMSLVWNGTNVLFGCEVGRCAGAGHGESTVAKKVIAALPCRPVLLLH